MLNGRLAMLGLVAAVSSSAIAVSEGLCVKEKKAPWEMEWAQRGGVALFLKLLFMSRSFVCVIGRASLSWIRSTCGLAGASSEKFT
jgi:hypothetical protein